MIWQLLLELGLLTWEEWKVRCLGNIGEDLLQVIEAGVSALREF